MDKTKIRKKDEKPEDFNFDTLKLYYLKKYTDVIGENLVFVVSPIWYGMDTRQLQPVIDLCKKRNIPFIDYSNNPKYVHNDYYFKDGTHMNARGADEFTQDLIHELKIREILK